MTEKISPAILTIKLVKPFEGSDELVFSRGVDHIDAEMDLGWRVEYWTEKDSNFLVFVSENDCLVFPMYNIAWMREKVIT